MPFSAPAAFSALIAALALVVVYSEDPISVTHPTEIALRSVRGPDSGESTGPANRPLHLTIQSAYLTIPVDGRVDIVDYAGNIVWTGQLTSTRGPRFDVDKSLKAGVYWVRLYAETNNKLLQEYSLRLE
ncbi:MAG: hypothetical protein ABI811_15685 [Acidobacteriota bacterium]